MAYNSYTEALESNIKVENAMKNNKWNEAKESAYYDLGLISFDKMNKLKKLRQELKDN